MTKTLNKHIRVDEQHWRRIEDAANRRGLSPSRLMIESTLEAIDRPEWPRTRAEVQVARASLFAAQAIARDMMAAGRKKEVQELHQGVSVIIPDIRPEASSAGAPASETAARGHEET